jgi:uncharacterized protein (DUF2147 family)
MGRMFIIAVVALVSFFGLSANVARAAPDIAALWATFDDQGRPTGFVRIALRGDGYFGVIERGLPGDDPERRCEACRGPLQGKKMLGLEILSGVQQRGEEFAGGSIVDPFSGNDYRVRLTPLANGARLQVRGFVGLEMFGRTQTWVREH